MLQMIKETNRNSLPSPEGSAALEMLKICMSIWGAVQFYFLSPVCLVGGGQDGPKNRYVSFPQLTIYLPLKVGSHL